MRLITPKWQSMQQKMKGQDVRRSSMRQNSLVHDLLSLENHEETPFYNGNHHSDDQLESAHKQ